MGLGHSENMEDRQDASLHSARPTILIIDDNYDNLLLLGYALEEIDYRIIKGSSGSEALKLAATHMPDLILLDVLLPDMNGTAVLKHLRQQPELKHTPIVAITALARIVDRSNIIAAGFTAYLSKPYMLDELYTLVSQYVG